MKSSSGFSFKAAIIIAASMSVVLAGVSISLAVSDALSGYKSATATITKEDKVYDPSLETTTKEYYVTYTVDGVEYRDVVIDGADPEYQVGKQIPIRYSPGDPSSVRTREHSYIYYLSIGSIVSGVAAITFGTIYGIRSSRKKIRALDEE